MTANGSDLAGLDSYVAVLLLTSKTIEGGGDFAAGVDPTFVIADERVIKVGAARLKVRDSGDAVGVGVCVHARTINDGVYVVKRRKVAFSCA